MGQVRAKQGCASLLNWSRLSTGLLTSLPAWLRRLGMSGDATRPLRIVKAVTSGGESVVGIEAVEEREMEHW